MPNPMLLLSSIIHLKYKKYVNHIPQVGKELEFFSFALVLSPNYSFQPSDVQQNTEGGVLKGFNHYRAARTRPFMSYQPLVLSRISGTGQRQNPLTFSTWLHPKGTTLPGPIIVPNLRATTTEFMSAWVSLLILSLNQFSNSKSDRTFFQNCYRCGLLCCFIERVFWHFLSGFSWE